MKKAKRVIGWLMLSQVVAFILMVLMVDSIFKHGFWSVLLVVEVAVFVLGILLFICKTAMDFIHD